METGINLNDLEVKSRLSSLMGQSKVHVNTAINLKKVAADSSDAATQAKIAFQRKPFYFEYNEKGMFK